MIARTKAPLVEAATGKKQTPEPPATQSPMMQAMQSKLGATPTYEDFASEAGLTTPPMTSTMGRSPEGKYGGFYTASDLDRAIRGETMSRNEQLLDYAQSLRDLAAKQRGQVQQTIRSQQSYNVSPYGAMIKPEIQEYGARRMEEIGKGDVLASQIEQTPASQLAQAIATRKYGVNPALAAGMYGTEYDIATAKDLRDEYYYQTGQGLGYEDYLSETARQRQEVERGEQEIEDIVSTAKRTQDIGDLEIASQYSQDARDLLYTKYASDSLGMNAAKLFSSSQVTPQQGYDLLSNTYNMPEAVADRIGSNTAQFADLAEDAFSSIEADDEGGAFATADALMANPETRVLGRLLATYVDALVRSVGKTGRGLYQYQQVSDILGQ